MEMRNGSERQSRTRSADAVDDVITNAVLVSIDHDPEAAAMTTVHRPVIARSPAAGRDRLYAYIAGMRAMLPWLVAVIPFGLVIGVTVAESSVSPVTGWATGPLIYAGSAQLSTVELLDRGAAPMTIVFTALVINARLIAYSGSIAVHWRDTHPAFRAVAAYLLVDPSFAVGMEGYTTAIDERSGHRHYLGGAVALWISWQSAILIGLTLGDTMPTWLHAEFVVPLFLVAEVVHHAFGDAGKRAAATVGALAALVGMSLPAHGGLIVAIALGITAASLTDRRRVQPEVLG